MFLEPRGRQKEPGCPVFGGFWTAQTRGAIHSTKIPTGPTGKSGPPQKVDPFFETFPVGPNRSIEFWTEISGNFGWMDRAPHQCSLWTGSVFPSPHPARLKACPQANINVPAQLYKNSGQAKALINQLNRLEQEKYLKLFQLLCLEVTKIN